MLARRKLLIFPLAATLIALLTGVIACSGADGEVEVDVSLSEWAVEPGMTSAAEGEITFAVSNAGQVPHNLVVVATDFPAGELSTINGSVDVSRLRVEGTAGPFAPGPDAGGLTLELTPGKYVLYCDVVVREGNTYTSHYENGMYASFQVIP